MHDCPGRTGEKAQILGYAGLLPQIIATAMTAMDDPLHVSAMFAFGYVSLILSFIGGIWWGFAVHRSTGQGPLAVISVCPALAAAAIILASIAGAVSLGWALVLAGSAVMLTLLVDREMARSGDTPEGWMNLRVPLSIALGVLTIVTGALN